MSNNIKHKYSISITSTLILLLVFFSCSREIDDLELATFPTNGAVFIDGFSAGLGYAAYGGSKVTAFEVDNDVAYSGEASMRFEIPDAGDPNGGYAGGLFFTNPARDLSGYDALTFWAKASKAANVDEFGFGNAEAQSQVTLSGAAINSNWKKYIIPIPNPSALKQEEILFSYAEAPEEDRGYTIWVDEVKFEKLGTLAHPRPAIRGGQDEAVSAETGDRIRVGGLSMTFNLPTGIDQTTGVGPAYFTFSSSNPSVATVNAQGEVTVLDAGEAVITAKMGELDAAGSLTITSTGDAILPPQSAPTPTVSQDSVISLFSNAYNNVTVDTWNPFWEFSTAEVADVQIGQDDLKRYKNLNFVGILTEANPIDATEMTHFHIDIWTPDPTAPPAAFRVLLVDFGADGNFGGGDDSSHELTFTSPTLQTESWVSLDIPLTNFTGLTNRRNIAQLVLSGDLPTVFVDNVYFYNRGSGGGTGSNQPMEAAPAPTRPAGSVISLFSDVYQDVPVDTWRTDWSSANFEDVSINGDAVKKYANLDFVGIETVINTIDASGMTHFHIDVWSPDFTSFATVLVDFGADNAFGGGNDVEGRAEFAAPAQGSWVSLDIPLSELTSLTTRSNMAQYILVGQPTGNNTVYVDNLYFYNEDGGGDPNTPAVAAPEPTEAAANVISLFSDAYDDVSVDNWRTDWSAADFEDVAIDGNPTKRYANLDFVGIETVTNTIDASEMTHFHIDVWSADYTFFGIKLVDFGADGAFGGGDDVEHQINYEMPAQGRWVSYDIPLSDFAGLTTRANIAQYILVGQPSGGTTVYVDNLYFYGEGGGGPLTEPNQPAPAPTEAAANVISLFSDAYNDVPVDNWRTDWSAANFEDVTVVGNPVKKYSNLDFVGIETVTNTIDASEMTHFHIDVWSADFTFFGIKLVDFGADGAFGGGDDVEHQINYEMPAQGQWVSYDIPLSDFAGLTTRANIAQYILVGQPSGGTTVYVDNMYFHK